MLQRCIRALANLSVNVKTYQPGISGVIARDTPDPCDCAKKCQQAFLAPLKGMTLGVKILLMHKHGIVKKEVATAYTG